MTTNVYLYDTEETNRVTIMDLKGVSPVDNLKPPGPV
jgi:hypothetical protein